MEILILGGSGRTGKHAVSEALKKGYEVNCLIRNPKELGIELEKLRLFKGSPINKKELKEAWGKSEVIISVLNISRTSDFPWAELKTPPTFMSDVMHNVIELAEVRSLKRLIVCSAWGVGEALKNIPFWFRWLIQKSNIGDAYKDHEKQEAIIKNSNLDWTLVRPTGLTNFDFNKSVIMSFENKPKPKLTIARKQLARFLVSIIEENTLINRCPTVSV